MGTFFLFNYRLLSLLEREDWPALAYYLEQKVFVKNRYSARNVRLLASSYLVISDFHSVLKLESKAMFAKPSVVDKSILLFGAARVISGQHVDAAAFFNSHMEKARRKDKQWVRWFYGFSHLLAGAFNTTEPEFTALALSSNDALITGLSSYFLFSSIAKYSLNPVKCREMAENGRKRVVKTLKNKASWDKEAEKLGTEIYIAIIRKYIDEAGKWLFDIIDLVPAKSEEVYVKRTQEKSPAERRTRDRRTDPNPFPPDNNEERRAKDRRTRKY
jgi:hypothetical protein